MKNFLYVLIAAVVLGALSFPVSQSLLKKTPIPSATITNLAPTKIPPATATALQEPTNTPVIVPTDTVVPQPTNTPVVVPTDTTLPQITDTPVAGPIAPYPSAPLCPDALPGAHDTSKFHTVWDSIRGCHYDHEHGQNPYTSEVAAVFPNFNLLTLNCNMQVGHCNPSSPVENIQKHGGMKIQVDISAPQGCTVGFESGTVAVDAYAIQYHVFGRQDIEFEARQHSTVALLRQCKPNNPNDRGYVYVGQLQEYGERCLPYQGQTLLYPDNPQPPYNCAFGQYFTTEGVGPCAGCRSDISYYTGALNRNNLSIWTSKKTGSGTRPPGSTLFNLLFRSRDNYQALNANDLVHPFTWLWACSNDGGQTYRTDGCRYNNSTTTIHEIKGVIPATWDNLAGFDTDMEVGRITAEGYVTRYGTLNPDCTSPNGLDCQPIKMVRAFVGVYSSELSAVKVSNPTPLDTPERDIYFCSGVVCSESDFGAVPSGWIGSNN